MLRTGVVRGVDRGVEFVDNNPLGRVSIRLIRFSFSSGTVKRIKKLKNKIFLNKNLFCYTVNNNASRCIRFANVI